MKQEPVNKEIRRQFAYFSRNYAQFDAVSNSALLSFLKTGFLCKHFLGRQLKSYGLTGQAFSVLLMLETLPDQKSSMREISRRLGVTQANVTGLVDTLERKRLVVRQSSSQDRRVIHVVLSATGKQKARSILPGHFRTVQRLFGDFSPIEKQQFSMLLQKFSRALN